jgi:elongation factor G
LICAPVQIPIGSDERLRGIVDIIHEKAYYFDGANGENIREEKVPDNLLELMKSKKL